MPGNETPIISIPTKISRYNFTFKQEKNPHIIHLMLEESQISSINVRMRNEFAQNFSLGDQQVKGRRQD